MYRFGKKVPLLLLVGLVSVGRVASRVDAQGYHREYKSGWYVDPVLSSPAISAVGSRYAHGHSMSASCPSCGIQGHAVGVHGHGHRTLGYVGEVLVAPGQIFYAMPQQTAWGVAGMSGSAANCPPPTTAFLRVWVDERATMWVNDQMTKPQRLAGANRGSRIFSLTGFAPGEIQEAVVEVALVSGGETVRLAKTLTAQAGNRYEVRFTKSEFVAARPIRRVTSNLLALYDFKQSNGGGNMVFDVSQQGSPLDLLISDSDHVKWSSDGLQVVRPVLIQSGQTADKIRTAVQGTNAISIEAWVTPADSSPALLPASIVSTQGHVTLAQHREAYSVRLSITSETNSLTSLTGTAPLTPTHVVATRDRMGTTKIYLNGRPFSRGFVGGELSSWRQPFGLLLANDESNSQPWLGTFHLVAIYSQALSDGEVQHNYQIGFANAASESFEAIGP